MTPEQIKSFQQDGYFVWRDVFSGEEIDAVRVLCDTFDTAHQNAIARGGNRGAGEITFTDHLAAQSPELAGFLVRPPFVDLATTLLGPDVSLKWDHSVYKRPESSRDFPWHQDNGYTSVVPYEYVTCWIPLEDVSLEMGPVWVHAQSHLQGVVEHRDTPLGKQCYFGPDPGIPVPIAKGSMIVFSSLLMHRSSPNLSSKTRRAYIVHYCTKDSRDGNTGLPLPIPVLIERGLPVPWTSGA